MKQLLDSATMLLPDPVDPGFDAQNPFAPPLQPDERVAVDGTFKTPGLRNVALTAPYFHNGGQATLAQVVEFYDRGGDFRLQNALTSTRTSSRSASARASALTWSRSSRRSPTSGPLRARALRPPEPVRPERRHARVTGR